MSFLFTGDLQAEWANLELCTLIWNQALDICQKEKLEGIVVCGDGKRHYNPIDGRVVLWWQRAIRKARERGFAVLYLLGNHDRFGMYTDSRNWLPILRRAGAKVYDEPDVYDTREGYTLHMLPFRTSTTELRHDAKKLAREGDGKGILVFHADLRGCNYNILKQKSEARFRAKELYPDKYLHCIGGHIHLHQKIGRNVYYVGSPFSTDWGESNQRKGFLIFSHGRLRFVDSRAPGLYDPSWPGFPRLSDWRGSRVRIHVECSGTGDYVRHLERARHRAESKYHGAQIFVVPRFRDEDVGQSDSVSGDQKGYSDSDEVGLYVDKCCPVELSRERDSIRGYLAAKLRSIGENQTRRADSYNLQFLGAHGQNFLSFKRLRERYTGGGITVVSGRNEDHPDRSNGAGKTSYCQLIPVALFGTTFKGQKYDRWARRGTKETAEVEVKFKDSRGRVVRVRRSRRPSEVRLTVNGRDESTGMDSRRKDATQGYIELLSGYTWETLANAVYIDSSISRTFLSGTRKERTQILARFQNLERFEKALELVREDKRKAEGWWQKLEDWMELLKEQLEDSGSFLIQLEKRSRQRIQIAKDKVLQAWKEWKQAQSVLANSKEELRIEKLQSRHFRLAKATLKERKRWEKAAAIRDRIGAIHTQCAELVGKKQCPTCTQPVDRSLIKKDLYRAEKAYAFAVSKVKTIWSRVHKFEARMDTISNWIQEIQAKKRIRQQKVDFRRSSYRLLKEQYEEQQQQERGQRSDVGRQKKKIRWLESRLSGLKKFRGQVDKDIHFYEFCEQAFSRDGVPALINMQLRPRLNKAADYYSELFCDKTIQVRFEVQDGEFEPQVINAAGGETFSDQSEGEGALAGLITSFALQDIAPRCNILVLDEPGDGLDPANARQFAGALRELKSRYETIYVVTHNQAILQELATERVVTVVKKHGISRVEA